MSYPKQHKLAHELLNFAAERGFVYGFVQHQEYDQINLQKLGAKAKDEKRDSVTVIWCALEEGTKRLRVVGWYDHATVFRRPQLPKPNSARGEWDYYFRTKAANAHLIPEHQRRFEVPMKVHREDKGYIGQRNWFYPETSNRYARFLESFSLLRNAKPPASPSDEEIAAFEEGQRYTSETVLSARNAKAVKAAKLKHGTRCQACNFSFKEHYGEVGEGFIEAHHRIELSSSASRLTTVDDINVLCSNCHRMVHRKSPPLTLDDLRRIIERNTKREDEGPR
jgi:5-methylcytosine-specific restriction protein A